MNKTLFGKFLASKFLIVILVSVLCTSCGMKRALTLSKEDKAKRAELLNSRKIENNK